MRKYEALRAGLLRLVLLLAAGAPLAAQSPRPSVPESYQHYFVHFTDKRTLAEKALNAIGLTNQALGRSFALVAGVSHYPNLPIAERELKPAGEDIRRMVEYLRDQEFFDEIVVLRDGQMTYENLVFFLQGYFPQRLQQFPRSRFLFAYSGHGMGDERAGYLLTSRAASMTDRYNSVSLSVLRDLLDEVVTRGHHVLVLLNACYGGALLKRPFGAQPLLPQQPGAHAITAGGTRELTWHQAAVGPGSIFFEKLFAGLDGRADLLPERPGGRGDGVITVDELSAYLRQEVRVSTDERQNPRVGDISPSGSKGGFFFLNRQRVAKLGIAPEWRAAAGRSFGPEPGSPVWEALERYRSEEYGAARSMFLRAAEEGTTDAMLYLAEMYDLGRGVPEDAVSAVRWYRRAAEAGDPRSMNEMGRRLSAGRGIAKDRQEAFRWYRKAAEAASPAGMNNVGVAYRRGWGVKRSDSDALFWFQKGAAAGHPEAMAELGAMYADGAGIAKDDAIAVEWFRKAVDGGAANGMRYLAGMHDEGRGVPKDERTAFRLLRKAAEAGDTPAMVLLGRKYLPLDHLEAKHWFDEAAGAGDPEGMRELSDAYAKGIGVKADEEVANRLLWQAGENDDLESLRRLGMETEGRSDPRQAIRWYRKAVALGDRSSLERLRTLEGLTPVFELTRMIEAAPRDASIRMFAFSADGRLLAFHGNNMERGLPLWDATGWKELRKIAVPGVPHCVVLSPGGRLGLCYFAGRYEAGVFDLTTGEPLAHRETAGAYCHGLRFTREDMLVGRDSDGLYWLSVPSGNLERYAHRRLLGFSSDGTLIALESEEGFRIEIRERATRRLRATLAGHKKTVREGAFSEDGRFLASSDGESIRIWDLSSAQAVTTIPSRNNAALAFSPDGTLLAALCESVVRLWDTKTGTLRQTIVEQEEAQGFAFRPDGKLLVTGHRRGRIGLWVPK